MSEGIHKFLDHFNEVTDDCGSFCCIARGKEFQIEAVNKIDQLLERTSLFKAKAIGIGDEDIANMFLSLEKVAKAMQSELRMWLSLKEDDPNQAWSHLVKAQVNAHSSIRAHKSASHISDYAHRLRKLEEVLFPTQKFTSMGYIVKESRCSICQSDYADCDHLKGKAYMGQFCTREILDGELLEVSLVTTPANRDCRVTHIVDRAGVNRDVMTWREFPKEGDGDITLVFDTLTDQ